MILARPAAAGFESDDNLPLAQREADVETDVALVASAALGRRWYLGDRAGLTLSGDVATRRQAEFTGLDNNAFGLTLALDDKLGLGDRGLRVRLAGSVHRVDYHHDPRDGWRYALSASAAKRVSERVDVRLAYDFDAHRSDEIVDIPGLVTNFGIRGDAFDVDGHQVSLRAVVLATERLAFVGHWALRYGEVAATTRIGPAVFRASDAITPDRPFGPDRFAYRVKARTHAIGLAASWAIGDHAAVDLGYERRYASADESFAYGNDLVRLNLRIRY